MKKLFLFGLAITALVLGSCSSDDDINDTKIVVNPNVSDSKLDQKSGGVYFVSTLAGEYIFRLNLKNGDDAMTCEMFHDENYSELAPAETAWEPGEVLDNLQFSSGEVKLVLSLNEDGEGEAQIFVGEDEFESVIFKSTAKEPVKVYSGDTKEYYKANRESPDRILKEVMVLQNDLYFYGILDETNPHSIEYMWSYGFKLSNKTESTFSYKVPDCPNAQTDDYTWERDNVKYDESIISWVFEDDSNPEEYFYSELTLHRRFKN
jgi:hypothetical protein